MRVKYNTFDFYIVVLGVYSFVTLTQEIYPINLNRILVVVMVMILGFSLLNAGPNKWHIAIYVYLLFLFGYNFFVSEQYAVSLLAYIRYTVMLLYLMLFSKLEAWKTFNLSYIKYSRFIHFVTGVDLCIILLLLLLPQGYEIKWGGETYLRGEHTMASGCCLAMSLMVLWLLEKDFSFFRMGILLIYLFAVLQAGARTFIIPALILLYCYIKTKVIKRAERYTIYALGMVGILLLFINSNMIKKFIWGFHVFSNTDKTFFSSLSSGRSTFWLIDLKDYFSSNILYQVIGHGFDYIHALNLEMTGMAVQAHNDFINVLVAAGILGLLIYILCWYKFFNCVLPLVRRKEKILLIVYFLFPAFINGFYTYYHLSSSFFVLTLIYFRIYHTKSNYSKIA